MRIHKFSKLKNGMYKVYLENSCFEAHEDLILKYELLLKKEITEEKLAALEKENIQYEAYDIAIKELKKRLRSSKELRNLLRKKEISNNTIDQVLKKLQEQGYLNDEVYADSYIHDHILLTLEGPIKIEKDLLDKGIPSEVIQKKLKQFDSEKEHERIQKIVQKHLKQNRKSVYEFRMKMKQLLNRLGYNSEEIQRVLEKITFDEKEIYNTEYQKIYRNLSKKYQGKDLENRIRQKLYQKGFKI